jgi:hypothetical protein
MIQKLAPVPDTHSDHRRWMSDIAMWQDDIDQWRVQHAKAQHLDRVARIVGDFLAASQRTRPNGARSEQSYPSIVAQQPGDPACLHEPEKQDRKP